MKLITCTYQGRTIPAVLVRDETAALPLAEVLDRPVPDMIAFIQEHTPEDIARLAEAVRRPGDACIPLAEVHLEAPVPKPAHDILCVGANYAHHVHEVRKEIDGKIGDAQQHTVYFAKRALYITGPDGEIESHRKYDISLDYEAELAVIIGRGGRDIPREEAQEYIFGYSVFNDFSARSLQKRHVQWFRGKSLDGYAAMGPCILHRGSVPYAPALDIRSWVNGELRQESNTSLMIADVAEIIHTLSGGMTLEPGDIIATGTPAGTGMGFDPPRYLKPGDDVCCEVEGIGRLNNTVR